MFDLTADQLNTLKEAIENGDVELCDELCGDFGGCIVYDFEQVKEDVNDYFETAKEDGKDLSIYEACIDCWDTWQSLRAGVQADCLVIDDEHAVSSGFELDKIITLAVDAQKQVQALYDAPESLVKKLVAKLGDNYTYSTKDGKHFYVKSNSIDDVKLRIADHSYKSGAGKLYGHAAPDVQVLFDTSMSLEEQEAKFWQEIDDCMYMFEE